MNTKEKGDNKQNRIETKELKIMENVFIYNETILPLSNISRISLTDAPTREYKISYFGAILVGVCLLFVKEAAAVFIGLAIATWGIWEIYSTNKYNDDRGEYLVLCLNSGEKMYFNSKDHEFARQVMRVITNCINLGDSFVINMERCTIKDSNFNEITSNLFLEG